MKIELFNLRLRLECSITKLATVTGINSAVDKDHHILLWDFDEVPLEEIVSDLKFLQHFCELPNIYIVQSSFGHYHAYCFAIKSWPHAIYLLASTRHICETFFKFGVIRGYWTLRITPKQVKEKLLLVKTLLSDVPEQTVCLDLLTEVKYKTGV